MPCTRPSLIHMPCTRPSLIHMPCALAGQVMVLHVVPFTSLSRVLTSVLLLLGLSCVLQLPVRAVICSAEPIRGYGRAGTARWDSSAPAPAPVIRGLATAVMVSDLPRRFAMDDLLALMVRV